MHENPIRPHDARTDEQLAALSEWLGRHLAELTGQYEAIQSELRSRGRNGPPPLNAAHFAVPVLSYVDRQTPMPDPLSTGDSYVDEARNYGMRVAYIFLALIAALGLAAFVAAARM